MDPNQPQQLIQNINPPIKQQIYNEVNKPKGKLSKFKLPIIILTSLILLISIPGVILAVSKPEFIASFGSKLTDNKNNISSEIQSGYMIQSKDQSTIKKIISIKQIMDKICKDYGYYDSSSVGKIDRKYPEGVYGSNNPIDVGCFDQDNASGKWPDKCMNGYIDYVLDSKSQDAPGESTQNENEYGNDWYAYSYKFKCNSTKSKSKS